MTCKHLDETSQSYNLIFLITRIFSWKRIFGPRQANLVLIAYASSEGSGEPAHPRSLARTFAARSYQTESQIPGPSEWLGMRSWNLSWRNAWRHKFAWRGSFIVFALFTITLLSFILLFSKRSRSSGDYEEMISPISPLPSSFNYPKNRKSRSLDYGRPLQVPLITHEGWSYDVNEEGRGVFMNETTNEKVCCKVSYKLVYLYLGCPWSAYNVLCLS